MTCRPAYERVDAGVRAWVERSLGSPVREATSQAGGFSPGAACRLVLADRRRFFLKAVSSEVNAESAGLHRREGEIAAALPPSPWIPALLDRYDDGVWVALLFADAGGSPPVLPWRQEDVGAVLDAIARLHASLTPAPVEVPTIVDHYGEAFSGWRRIAAGEPGTLDAWSERHLARLAELEAGWPTAAAGDTLLHGDLRADNILLTDQGVRLVDWPWACRGAGWLDVCAFAPSVAMQGGPDPEWLLAQYPGEPIQPVHLDAVVAAVAGYFAAQSAKPDPPGLPNLRTFQAEQGGAARTWLRNRLGWA